MPTWLGGDHIRFSWCVVVALLLSQVQLKQMHSTKLKVINVVLQVWLCIYLHILGSKTGLVLLYTTILLGLLYAIVYLKKYTYAPYLLLLCLCPVVAYYTIPTFASRVHYMWYDYTMYSQGRYLTGLSDGARVLSIKAGLATVSTQPWLGIGYGHIDAAMAQYYKAHTALQPYEYIWPSSQWLVAATTIGVVGGSILLLCVVKYMDLGMKLFPLGGISRPVWFLYMMCKYVHLLRFWKWLVSREFSLLTIQKVYQILVLVIEQPSLPVRL